MKLLAVAISALSLCLFAWTAYQSSQDRQQVDAIVISNCEQIEKLKLEFRTDAIEGYQNLERDAALLGIVLTPELRATALEERNKTLRRFRAVEC